MSARGQITAKVSAKVSAGSTAKVVARILATGTTLSLLFLSACDPQKGHWGFEAIDQMKTPPDNPALGCGVTFPDEQHASERGSCTYTSLSVAPDTLGVDGSALAAIPIEHVIVLMKENRSFDHLLGKLRDRGQPGVDAIPANFANPDKQGNSVPSFHQTNTCFAADPNHQSASVLACVDRDRATGVARMDGFVQNADGTNAMDPAGKYAMGYYDESDLPFYYFLAKTYALGDSDFAPMASGTYGNRNFLMFAKNAGVVDTGIVFAPPTTTSILHLLMNAGRTWAAYTDGDPWSGAFNASQGDPGVHTMDELFAALDQGKMPSVAWVDGADYVTDDHPDADLQAGEAWMKKIYDHAIKSPQWPRMAILWTYDECGGFADHVPPPTTGCPATPGSPFTELGPRIPLVVISPWAKRNFVSHVVRDHTAITRFIEALFGLPALSARDANSDALLDMFDFTCGRDLSIPVAPAAGTGSCKDPAPAGTN